MRRGGGARIGTSDDRDSPIVDGLTVENCTASKPLANQNQGGGLAVGGTEDNRNWIRNVTLVGCSNRHHSQTLGGGAMLTFTDAYNVNAFDCHASVTNGNTAVGGGIYLKQSALYGSVISNCSVSTTFETASNVGGGGICTDGASTVSNCLVTCCAATNAAGGGWMAFGGGLYSRGGAPLVADCSLTKNFATALGGAMSFSWTESATVLRTDISGNSVDPANLAAVKRGGTAVAADRTVLAMRGCRVSGNRAEWNSDLDASRYLATGAAIYCQLKSRLALEDCVFDGNVSSNSASAVTMGTLSDGLTVTNCVFRGNVGHRGGAVLAEKVSNGVEIVDSRFVDNRLNASSQSASAVYVLFATNNAPCALVRNSLFTGNSGGQVIAFRPLACDVRPSFRVENCTIADNAVSGQAAVWVDTWNGSYGQADDLHVSGCVSLFNGKAGFDPRCPDVTSSCYAQAETADAAFANGSNVLYDPARPLFADRERRDFRPAQGSQLRARVPKADWMGDGTRNRPTSVYDLGSGCEIEADGPYGVAVRRLDAVPRLYCGTADIGCCQYWQPLGLSVVFR